MTERERLIELLDIIIQPGEKTLGDIADHLLANGVIVPPCKVGDIVWSREGEPHKVVSIEWYSPKVMHLHCEHRTFSVGKRSLARTVFLAREEAEKALERSRG